MSEEPTSLPSKHALYLPALPLSYAKAVVGKQEGVNGIRPADLNFLNSGSRLWTYKRALATAGQYAFDRAPNAVTHRDPKNTLIMGDSGGYQIGLGTLPGMKGWKTSARKPDIIIRNWKEGTFRDDLRRWLQLNTDYALTIDHPPLG